MTRYVVLEPGAGPSAQAVFLRDRFHIVAFLLPFVWLAAHKLFLSAILAFLVSAGLIALGQVEGFALASNALALLFGVAVALEGPRLVARRLVARGYREADILHAADIEEAELLYYGTGAAAPLAAPLTSPLTTPLAQPTAEHGATALPLLGWQSGRALLDTGPR